MHCFIFLTEGVALGVIRPDIAEGYFLSAKGVILPNEFDGVIRPLPSDMVADGVTRPLREEVTDGGRKLGPTVGADNLADATKTPQLGGHMKYRFLENDASVSTTQQARLCR